MAAPSTGQARQDVDPARSIRAQGLVAGLTPAQIASEIHARCAPVGGTTRIRACRLALGVSLADVVAQVRAWYESESRPIPKFSETLLSAYESGQKRPGPEYLHYLCKVYRAEPSDLGYPHRCFCGRTHREDRPAEPGASARLRRAVLATDAQPSAAVPGQSWVTAAEEHGARLTGPAHAEVVLGRNSVPPAPAVTLHAVPDPDPAAPAVPAGLAWPAEPRPPADAGDAVVGVAGLAAEAEDDDDVLRRALLRLIANAAAPVDSQFLGAVDRIRRRMDEALVGGSVSAIMLDQWEEATVGYAWQYMTVPPLRLLCDVLLDFGDVRRMCERRQPLDFSQRLCRLAGQLAGLTGMIMIDVGDQRMARSFFRTARTAADETGDRHLRAWVTVREALVPLYYGDAAEACTLARVGAGLAGRNPCVAGVMAPVMEARSLARSAARREIAGKRQALRRVTSLLGHAHDALACLPEAVRSDTTFGYTERQLLFHEGDTLVALGHHQGAEAAFERALRLYPPAEMLDRSLVELGLARCLLEADEPEEALLRSRNTVFGLPPEHRSEIVVRTARSLGDSVAGRYGELPAVREYREVLLSA